MINDVDDYLIISKYEILQGTRKWINEIPYISFPPFWEVQIIPPFGGAICRFRIKYKNICISVYLDCYDRLGCFGEPYWEVFPYDEDVYRVEMNDTITLVNAIDKAIKMIDGVHNEKTT